VKRTTYAVVTLFGIVVYDVNAIESNAHPLHARYRLIAEIVALMKGNDDVVVQR